MLKKIRICLILLVLLFPIIVSAETYREQHANNQYALVIEDSAELFTREQVDSLKSNMLPLVERGNVVLKTMKSPGDYNSLQTPAQETYNKLFADNNGVIVLINIYNGESTGNLAEYNSMTIASFGNNKSLMSDTQATEIIWKSMPALKEEKYLETTQSIFNSINEYYAGEVSIKAGDKVRLEDDADLLNPEEEAKLIDVMTPLTEYGNIVFKTINENDTTADQFAKSYYYRNYGKDSGSILLIDMDNRMIYIYSAGYNFNIITNNKAEIITDNIYKYAASGNYYECAQEAFVEMKTILDGGKIAEPMRYASNVVISLVIGFLLTFFFVAASMRIKRSSNSKKVDSFGRHVAIANISVVASGTHRVYSPISDDSGFSSGGGGGGGFSGGGGGGGGASGGGGGHSF